MLYRKLGKTGLEISTLGYGAWGIGGMMWIGADDDESLRALRRAISLGRQLHRHRPWLRQRAQRGARRPGRARLVRDRLRGDEDPAQEPALAGPAGVRAEAAFPADWIVGCTNESLQRLGVETIDVQQFHVWSDEWVGQGDWLEGVEQLKRDGKIRFFGVSINDHQPANAVRLVESGHVDTVQVIYNSFDQSPEDELFPAVEAAGVGVIARVPFDEGSLTGRIRPTPSSRRATSARRYFGGDRRQQVWDRAQAIAADLGVTVDELAEHRASLLRHASRRVMRDSRHALGGERRAERRLGRRRPAHPRADRGAPRPPLGAQLLRLRRGLLSPSRSRPAGPSGRGRGDGAGAIGEPT